jgi:hypothetical protein
MGRFVRPETCRLTLANGDTLTVKKRLTHGEQRAAYARMYDTGVDGALKVNPLQLGMALVTAYLVDWHLHDDDVSIRGLSADELTTVLDTMAPEDFAEIRTAVEQHEAAMLAERTAAKNGTAGERGSAAISPSPFAAA